MIEQCPESADYGYWYVVLAVPDPEQGGKTPGEIPGIGWCAWYATIGGVDYVAVRTPEPVVGVETVDISVQAVLDAAGYTGKPYGRIGGA